MRGVLVVIYNRLWVSKSEMDRGNVQLSEACGPDVKLVAIALCSNSAPSIQFFSLGALPELTVSELVDLVKLNMGEST